MSDKVGPYRVVDLSAGRRIWLNVLDLPAPRNCMYGLLEVDVTRARQFIAEHKTRTGETLSFTGFLTYCLARAVDEDKSVQAYLKGHKQIVLFDDVNVGLMVENNAGTKSSLMGTVIAGANHMTFREIHEAMLRPWPLSSLFKALLTLSMRRDPMIPVTMGGTVGVTAVGMFGEGHCGWGLFPVNQVLGLIVGSIAWKPAVVEGRVEPREILHLTVMFDHDIVDGAPAARFTRRLVEFIESGYGLDEEQPTAMSGGEAAAVERERVPA
jgi:pyruvate/2-oxoglutarate dehydrogenase complex dihydrolipoamide acyltransferase (E2) component